MLNGSVCVATLGWMRPNINDQNCVPLIQLITCHWYVKSTTVDQNVLLKQTIGPTQVTQVILVTWLHEYQTGLM